MKKAYKQLQKKLKDDFAFARSAREYYTLGTVGQWVKYCGIKPNADHTTIICKIMGSVPYPYQERDRKIILKYLKKNKYKDFMKQFKKELEWRNG